VTQKQVVPAVSVEIANRHSDLLTGDIRILLELLSSEPADDAR